MLTEMYVPDRHVELLCEAQKKHDELPSNYIESARAAHPSMAAGNIWFLTGWVKAIGVPAKPDKKNSSDREIEAGAENHFCPEFASMN
jgi:hypothetical protein